MSVSGPTGKLMYIKFAINSKIFQYKIGRQHMRHFGNFVNNIINTALIFLTNKFTVFLKKWMTLHIT